MAHWVASIWASLGLCVLLSACSAIGMEDGDIARHSAREAEGTDQTITRVATDDVFHAAGMQPEVQPEVQSIVEALGTASAETALLETESHDGQLQTIIQAAIDAAAQEGIHPLVAVTLTVMKAEWLGDKQTEFEVSGSETGEAKRQALTDSGAPAFVERYSFCSSNMRELKGLSPCGLLCELRALQYVFDRSECSTEASGRVFVNRFARAVYGLAVTSKRDAPEFAAAFWKHWHRLTAALRLPVATEMGNPAGRPCS